MLYISTRSKTDSFTAHRVLHENNPPDGGMFIPFRLTAYSEEAVEKISSGGFGEIAAELLNLFFGSDLSRWAVECYLGRTPLTIEPLGQKIYLASFQQNAEYDFYYLEKTLSEALGESVPTTWTRIVVRIAAIAAVFSDSAVKWNTVPDLSVASADFETLLAALYGKHLGFPIGKIICSIEESCDLWNFISYGEVSTNSCLPREMEHFIYILLGRQEAERFRLFMEENKNYRISQEQGDFIRRGIFPVVVGRNREQLLSKQIYSSSHILLPPSTAGCCGGIQDYRAHSGECRETILLATSDSKE